MTAAMFNRQPAAAGSSGAGGTGGLGGMGGAAGSAGTGGTTGATGSDGVYSGNGGAGIEIMPGVYGPGGTGFGASGASGPIPFDTYIYNGIDGTIRGGDAGGTGAQAGAGIMVDYFGKVQIVNEGLIMGGGTAGTGGAPGIALDIGSHASSIVNLGAIVGTYEMNNLLLDSEGPQATTVDIWNFGIIDTLTNGQGGNGSDPAHTALNYFGFLPTNYNIFVDSQSHYGQLNVIQPNIDSAFPQQPWGGTGDYGSLPSDNAMTVGVLGLDPSTATHVYEYVIQGVNRDEITNEETVGIAANGVLWALADAQWRGVTPVTFEGSHYSDYSIWDLRVLNFGQDMAEPQRAMLEKREAVIRQSLDYDCNIFDNGGGCVSFRARYSNFNSKDEGAGVLTIAKDFGTGIRAGAFIDINGKTKDEAGINNSAAGMSSLGGFIAYGSGKDGTGFQARAAGAYGYEKVDLSRTNLLGSATIVSGKSDVKTVGFSQEIGWGLGLSDKAVLTPHIGIRYTQSTRAGYDEAGVDGIINDPFSYAAYAEDRLTGTAGLRFNSALSDNVNVRLGVGAEYDVSYHLDDFTLSSANSSFATASYISSNKPRSLRAAGSAGISVGITDNQSITLDVAGSQMDYGTKAALSVLAGFQSKF
jgi:hypothetical protein